MNALAELSESYELLWGDYENLSKLLRDAETELKALRSQLETGTEDVRCT